VKSKDRVSMQGVKRPSLGMQAGGSARLQESLRYGAKTNAAWETQKMIFFFWLFLQQKVGYSRHGSI